MRTYSDVSAGKFSSVLDTMADYISISPHFAKYTRLIASLLVTFHIQTCLWWLWKVLGMTVEEVEANLDSMTWGLYTRYILSLCRFVAISRARSLSCMLYSSNGRNGLHTVQGKVEAYVISIYITSMTVTTVGYGDITAQNTSERVGYTFFFIASSYLWSTLIAEVALLRY
jgi:hypothetical protein